jgi:hypothetical protein
MQLSINSTHKISTIVNTWLKYNMYLVCGKQTIDYKYCHRKCKQSQFTADRLAFLHCHCRSMSNVADDSEQIECKCNQRDTDDNRKCHNKFSLKYCIFSDTNRVLLLIMQVRKFRTRMRQCQTIRNCMV